MWCSTMPGQIAGGDFANRPRAESTESTESFQPDVLGEAQIPSISVTVIHQFQSRSGKKLYVHSVLSAVPLDAQSGTCCASRTPRCPRHNRPGARVNRRGLPTKVRPLRAVHLAAVPPRNGHIHPAVTIRQRLKHRHPIFNIKRVETDHRDCKTGNLDLRAGSTVERLQSINWSAHKLIKEISTLRS
jgi:hypothetical protein